VQLFLLLFGFFDVLFMGHSGADLREGRGLKVQSQVVSFEE
jgi:hypothetical protein